MMHVMTAASAALTLAAAAGAAFAQEDREGPVELDPQSVQRVLVDTAPRVPAFLPAEFTVSGETVVNTPVLSAQRLVFEPGASLVFSDAAIELGRGHVFVLAEAIVLTDRNEPSRISAELFAPPAQSDRGRAPDGGRDANGGDGAVGVTGLEGVDAPDLTIVTRSVGGPVLINLKGGAGGQGGRGQHGGNGGRGGDGHDASTSAFDCRRGAGDGRNGGRGGNGGEGGRGGPGGAAGSLTLLTEPDAVPTATRLITAELSGGGGGAGGPGGGAGRGGPGGQGGDDDQPWCNGHGSNGSTGPAGSSGAQGPSGDAGASGRFFVGAMSVEDLDRLFAE
jgi:hypothetical protein